VTGWGIWRRLKKGQGDSKDKRRVLKETNFFASRAESSTQRQRESSPINQCGHSFGLQGMATLTLTSASKCG
jgi:hypothetical protein